MSGRRLRAGLCLTVWRSDTLKPLNCLRGSRVAETPVAIPACTDASLDELFGDAYGVQHHGDESPQAIQSVALHLLNVHGIITSHTTRPGWALGRALRTRGVFPKLTPPALGSALTIRHLFPGGGVAIPVTRTQYVLSVYRHGCRFIAPRWRRGMSAMSFPTDEPAIFGGGGVAVSETPARQFADGTPAIHLRQSIAIPSALHVADSRPDGCLDGGVAGCRRRAKRGHGSRG